MAMVSPTWRKSASSASACAKAWAVVRVRDKVKAPDKVVPVACVAVRGGLAAKADRDFVVRLAVKAVTTAAVASVVHRAVKVARRAALPEARKVVLLAVLVAQVLRVVPAAACAADRGAA